MQTDASTTARDGETVVLDGSSLSLDQLVQVARGGARVELAPAAAERMREGRRVVEAALASGEPVYGLTTGVGALKRVTLDPSDAQRFNHATVLHCLVGQGAAAGTDQVRATMVRLLNGLANPAVGARPEAAGLVADALNERRHPTVRILGSVGQADLAPMADLVAGLLEQVPFELAAGEGLALISNNSFSTGTAALAVHDAGGLLRSLEVTAALACEGFAANLSILHPVLAQRPYPGLQRSADRLRRLLAGSRLWDEGAARNLQDPLTFRCVPQVLGAFGDALAYTEAQLVIELNAAQSNPLVSLGERQLVSGGCFDALPLAAALDFLRIALAPVVTSSAERVAKLLWGAFSGLPAGLADRPGEGDDGYSEFGVAAQSIAAEARLLAHPVSFEVVSSSQAEGIEDRMTMAPLAARRLAEMVALAERVAAIELLIAARAVDLRGEGPLGTGTRHAHQLVRGALPLPAQRAGIPTDLEPVVALVRSGQLGAPP